MTVRVQGIHMVWIHRFWRGTFLIFCKIWIVDGKNADVRRGQCVFGARPVFYDVLLLHLRSIIFVSLLSLPCEMGLGRSLPVSLYTYLWNAVPG